MSGRFPRPQGRHGRRSRPYSPPTSRDLRAPVEDALHNVMADYRKEEQERQRDLILNAAAQVMGMSILTPNASPMSAWSGSVNAHSSSTPSPKYSRCVTPVQV